MLRKIMFVFFILIFSNTLNAIEENTCKYHTETITNNGKIISEKKTKVCNETVKINNKGIVETVLTDPAYETAVIMTFLFLLENVLWNT